MPFRGSKSRKFRRTFKKRSFRRKSYGRKFSRRSSSRKMRPTTSKDRVIVSDRKFVNFKYVSLTTGAVQTIGGNPHYLQSANGYGMLDATDNPAAPTFQMFLFSPNYTGNTVFDPTASLALPGNSLSMVQTAGAFTDFSDAYEQISPTGTLQWSNFYQNYICHGSSVEVTLVDSLVPGQLFIIPVPTESSYEGSDTLSLQYTFADPNIISLISTFDAIPDEQAYCKIKLVSSAGGMDKVRLKHKMLTKKLFDIRTLRDDTANKATLNTQASTIPGNPNNQWIWLIGFIPSTIIPSTSTLKNVCTVQVKVAYHCELADRNELDYVKFTS